MCRLMLLRQDCFAVVAPFPNNPRPLSQFDVRRDFSLDGDGLVWYARPQLFFSCTLCRAGEHDDPRRYTTVDLVFFTAFEPITLTPDSVMQRNGVPMLYEAAPGQVPTLYLAEVERMLGRVPMIPCFLEGQSVNTIPHSYRGRDLGGATADSSPGKGNGATLWEVQLWMWRYGRSLPRNVTIAEAAARRAERLHDQRKRAAATRKRRREEAAERRRAGAQQAERAAAAADSSLESGSDD